MDPVNNTKTERTVFVGKLPHDVNERELDKLFYDCGRILRINIKRGFAFIEFETEKDAEIAVREVNGQRLGRESIIVERARGKKMERTECFTCGKTDHWAKNCPMNGRGRIDYPPMDHRKDYRPRGDYYPSRIYPRNDYRQRDDYHMRDDYRQRDDYYRPREMSRSPSRSREYAPRERYPRDISSPRRYERRDEEASNQRMSPLIGPAIPEREEGQNKMEE